MVRRIFVEKRDGMALEAEALRADIGENLGIGNLDKIRILNRYDVSGILDDEYNKAKTNVFAKPQLDICYDEKVEDDSAASFAVEYLPGQYDQREDSAEQCIQLLTGGEKPIVSAAKVYMLYGNISSADVEKIKQYLINPIECREASPIKPETLEMRTEIPADVEVLEGFSKLSEEGLEKVIETLGLAMDTDDLRLCRDYFARVDREPTITEIRMLDTYWSDHCRHTTFLTELSQVDISDKLIKDVFDEYLNARKKLGREEKPVCLMDIATIAARELSAAGLLENLDKSEEVNACSVVVGAKTDRGEEEYLVMFKNETHNPPTEIEPFGGASTCLGGAIRDPLSGRAYVYQAMRITGAGDPNAPLSDTLPGKLPQRKITTTAAAGYSSYGNQIGLSAGLVKEIYHPGYVAKRMEMGALIAAAPKKNVVRRVPSEGDVVILLGGKTGRDGLGGATGSSKAQTEESLEECGAQVQKGNAPEERKIQRLFRRENVAKMILRCNDFGAGGVSVAIGELASGVKINLDAVPTKYEGMDGTEIAISESQERMAVVVSGDNCDAFINAAAEENLDATRVAEVTSDNRLVMTWRGKKIVDLERDFLDLNGAPKTAAAVIEKTGAISMEIAKPEGNNLREKWFSILSDLNVCSQKGLADRFDSTAGASTVFLPYGGKHQQTPAESMVAKLPIDKGEMMSATIMSHGYNPYLSEQSPFHGAAYAVIEAITKIVAAGGNRHECYLSFQEFFESLSSDPKRWGKPMAALLGAYYAQKALGVASIGGKDSMSGSFNDLDVPPTLVAVAVSILDAGDAVSNEFKSAGSKVYLLSPAEGDGGLPDMTSLLDNFDLVAELIKNKKIKSSHTVCGGGICEALSRMCFGNMIGVRLETNKVFDALYGSIIIETDEEINHKNAVLIGETISDEVIYVSGEKIDLGEALSVWQKPLSKVFPETTNEGAKAENISFYDKAPAYVGEKIAAPRVFIPIFPGTNCEYETEKAFSKAGAVVSTLVIKNLNANDISETFKMMKNYIDRSQIIMLAGGASGGDEPDGAGKFIATALRNPDISESIMNLLKVRDGLILGISNGFQALINLGLLPYGEIRDLDESSPALAVNKIGRHMSGMVRTRISSVKSPWLSGVNVGDIHTLPFSSGEGRFVADDKMLKSLIQNGQIATQYVDLLGNAAEFMPYNPSGSEMAVEGITSPDGRVFGKMAHSERVGENVHKNVSGEGEQKIFISGVKYFK